ncbi:MAG: hypothetical protein WC459_02800 [Patescibacteria group bacterium]
MENGKIKTNHILVIKNPSKKRMLRVINEADYENCDTRKMGFIFGLLDVDMGAQNNKIFDILSEGIARYYKNLLEYDIAFDDLINFLNRRVIQIFPDQDIKEKCSALIGVLKEGKILFCASGNISSFLIYPYGVKKILPEESERTIDVSNKLFSYSLNGEVSKNYTIYFCNQDLKEVINPYYLEKAIKESGASNIIKSIQDYLLEHEKEGQYGSFWIYYGSGDKKNSEAAQNSLMEVFKNEKKTEENLSPSLITSINSAIKDKPLLTDTLKYSARFLKFLFNASKRLLFLFGFILFNSFFIITNARGKRKEKQLVINNRFKGFGFKIKGFYNSLTSISKILLSSLLFLAFALTGAITYSVHLQKIKQLKLAYKQNIEKSENFYNEAEADVIFQQKNIAIKKLKSAISLLEEMPIKIRDNAYDDLVAKVRDRLYKLQNISEVTAPITIADFSAEADLSLYPPLYFSKEKISLFSQDQIINIDAKNQNIVKNQLKIMGLDSGNYFYYFPNSALYSVDKGSTLQISYPETLVSDLKEIALGPNETIEKFVVYNDIMYTLSITDKYFSIWKHNPSLTGFGKPSLWATDNLPAESAPVSFSIDGSLYILFSNNQIYKYYQGRKMDWKYDAEEAPDKTNYSKIITNENLKNIYLAGNNIISIISKEGDFLAHLLLPALNNVKDIAVDESTTTIYALDGKKIYAFTFSL